MLNLNQSENKTQQIMSPEEMRQYLLAEIEASWREVAELNDVELETIAAGAAFYIPRWVESGISRLGLKK